jgi:hypothetical protein
VLVTQTVLETVKEAKPTKNSEGNSNGGKKKGGDSQGAKETVTTTVTAGAAQETSNNNNNGNNNNNEASSKSGNAEATQSANAEQSGNNNNNEQASRTREPDIPMSTGRSGKGGVIVPLSAVVPQGDVAMSEIMGTNFAVSGFTYKNKARARLVRRANTKWYEG